MSLVPDRWDPLEMRCGQEGGGVGSENRHPARADRMAHYLPKGFGC